MTRFTLFALVVFLPSFGYFLKYLSRWLRERGGRRRPGSHRPAVGRYGGRFLFSGVMSLCFLALLALGAHFDMAWQPFNGSTLQGKVKAHRDGEAMVLELKLAGVPDQTVSLVGKFWIVRSETIVFNPRLRAVGLGGYYRVRSVDGLVDRGQRIAGGYAARQELQPSSLVFRGARKLGFLSSLLVAAEDASPLKDPKGETELWAIPGGSAG